MYDFIKALSKSENWVYEINDKESQFNYLMKIPDLFIRNNADGNDKMCAHMHDINSDSTIMSSPTSNDKTISD